MMLRLFPGTHVSRPAAEAALDAEWPGPPSRPFRQTLLPSPPAAPPRGCPPRTCAPSEASRAAVMDLDGVRGETPYGVRRKT